MLKSLAGIIMAAFLTAFPCVVFGEIGSVPASLGTLATLEKQGGMCPQGLCRSSVTISLEGIIQFDSMGHTSSRTLAADELAALHQVIGQTDFETIKSRPFLGECPTAYDGQEDTYTFYLPDGVEAIRSCEFQLDASEPVFKQLEELIAKYIQVDRNEP